MEPVTGAVVAIVIWFFLISAGYFVFTLVFGLLGGLIGGDAGGIIGTIIGYVLGAAWAIFAIVKLILEIVHVLQLVQG
jgi:predicted lipid-binding transport protein (Tim44 family)